jgi:putative hemolysin
MKKILIYLLIAVPIFIFGVYFGLKYLPKNSETPGNTSQTQNKTVQEEKTKENTKEETKKVTSFPNPASVYCEDHGGTVEIVTNKDGSQFGMCNFADYSCEEWVYYRGECTVDADAKAIEQDLKNAGRDLTGMKVEIKKHLGRDILGAVVPKSTPIAGGGYVFAVKDENGVTVLADGNGIIQCSSFAKYPDFSTYLLPDCLDDSGNIIKR